MPYLGAHVVDRLRLDLLMVRVVPVPGAQRSRRVPRAELSRAGRCLVPGAYEPVLTDWQSRATV
jgi:hypothetical protein